MVALRCTKAILPMCKSGAICRRCQYGKGENKVLLMRNNAACKNETTTFVLRLHIAGWQHTDTPVDGQQAKVELP